VLDDRIRSDAVVVVERFAPTAIIYPVRLTLTGNVSK
jgi:hypothetical protein